MGRYIFSKLAESDLIEIYRYGVLHHGQQQADSYADTLKQACELLADTPLLCRTREEFMPPVRIYHHKRHLIVFKIEEDGIFIVRILHDRMDIERHLE